MGTQAAAPGSRILPHFKEKRLPRGSEGSDANQEFQGWKPWQRFHGRRRGPRTLDTALRGRIPHRPEPRAPRRNGRLKAGTARTWPLGGAHLRETRGGGPGPQAAED